MPKQSTLTEIVASQLRLMADEDDQLGRGEFKLVEVTELEVNESGDCATFAVRVKDPDDKERTFTVCVEEY